MFRLRNTASPNSCIALPVEFAVAGKSSAIRGGVLMENPAGAAPIGSFSVILTTVRPVLPRDTATASMLLSAHKESENSDAQVNATTCTNRRRQLQGKGRVCGALISFAPDRPTAGGFAFRPS